MKKVYILVTLTAMLFALTACGNSGNSTTSDNSTAAISEEQNGTDGNADNSNADISGASGSNAADSTDNNADASTDDSTAASDVVLGNYKNLEVTVENYEVSEQDILDKMYETLVDYAVEAADGHTVIQPFDVANIDFEGLLNGVAFDGGTAAGYNMVVGASGFIEGFDEGLLGVGVGETVALNLTFPDDYTEPTLAGQEVVFNVTVNSLKVITDEVVAANTEYTSLDAYKSYYTEYLTKQVADSIEVQKENDLLDLVVENSVITADHTEEIAAYVESYISYYESYASENYGVDLDTFLYYMYGMTTEGFTAQLTSDRAASLQYKDVLLAIAEAEGLEITDDEYNEKVDEMMREYGYETAEELETAYTKEALEESFLCDEAMQLVKDNAIITEN